MTATLVLEEFRDTQSGPFMDGLTSSPVSPNDIEAARSEGYEQGYSAGWDDASRASLEDQNRISTEFAHNLLDLNFTFHEARSHVLCSVAPVLKSALERILPSLVSRHLGDILTEQLLPLLETAADIPVRIIVAPGNREPLQAVLDTVGAQTAEIVVEESLGQGQVRLQAGTHETLVDLDGAIARILDALDTVRSANQEALSHG